MEDPQLKGQADAEDMALGGEYEEEELAEISRNIEEQAELDYIELTKIKPDLSVSERVIPLAREGKPGRIVREGVEQVARIPARSPRPGGRRDTLYEIAWDGLLTVVADYLRRRSGRSVAVRTIERNIERRRTGERERQRH